MCPRKDEGHSPAHGGCHRSGFQKVVLTCIHTRAHVHTPTHTPSILLLGVSRQRLHNKLSLSWIPISGNPHQISRAGSRAGVTVPSRARETQAVLRPLASTRLPHPLRSPHLAPLLQCQHGLKPPRSLSLRGVGASLSGKCVSAALFMVVELFSSN